MTESEFSLSALVGVGAGSQQALMRQLDTHVERERKRPWPKGWIWRGSATYLKRFASMQMGNPFPDEWETYRGEEERCHWNAWHAAMYEPKLRYFTGVYLAGTFASEHSWCVDPQGRVVELTLPAVWPEGSRVRSTMDATAAVNIPLPPERMAYFGLEFDVAFVSQWVEVVDHLPILDLELFESEGLGGRYTIDPMMRHNYRKEGVPL